MVMKKGGVSKASARKISIGHNTLSWEEDSYEMLEEIFYDGRCIYGVTLGNCFL